MPKDQNQSATPEVGVALRITSGVLGHSSCAATSAYLRSTAPNSDFTDLASEDDLPDFSREEVTIVNFLTMCRAALEPDPVEVIKTCRLLCKHRTGLTPDSLEKCLKLIGYHEQLPYARRWDHYPSPTERAAATGGQV